MSARVLVIDNYDSFVYNLVQYIGELGAEPLIYRNNDITVEAADELAPDAVLISPGPGTPEQAGVSNDIVAHFGSRLPVLGVCLGHQCIGSVYGAEIVRAPELMHGRTSMVEHNQAGLFAGLTTPFEATRYHSLVIQPDSVPDCLEVTARSTDGIIMGVRHKSLNVEGVQFHPESILTASGHDLIQNFLNRS